MTNNVGNEEIQEIKMLLHDKIIIPHGNIFKTFKLVMQRKMLLYMSWVDRATVNNINTPQANPWL